MRFISFSPKSQVARGPALLYAVTQQPSFFCLFSASLNHLHHHCLLFEAGFLLSSRTWGRQKEKRKFRGRDYSLNQRHGSYIHHVYSYCTGQNVDKWPHDSTVRAGKCGFWLGTSLERRGRWILVGNNKPIARNSVSSAPIPFLTFRLKHLNAYWTVSLISHWHLKFSVSQIESIFFCIPWSTYSLHQKWVLFLCSLSQQ